MATRQYQTPQGFVNETTSNEYMAPIGSAGFVNETVAAAATFIPQPNKPILQAVNRASTY